MQPGLQQLLLRTIDGSAGQAPARKTHAAEREVAEDVAIDCHLKSPLPLNNGWLRRHAEVSLQFQGDLLGGAHVP